MQTAELDSPPDGKTAQGKMADILILIGTESGNAQLVGDTLQDTLTAKGHKVAVDDNAGADAVTGAKDVVLIVTATTGMGDLPANIQPLADQLTEANADLSHLRYGVIALGDQTYQDTFCGGGKKMDALFEKLGAKRVGDRLEIDACTQPVPDEEAVKWVEEWERLL
jgi:MioC protein